MILFECEIPGRPIVKKNTRVKYNVYSQKFRIWERNALILIRQRFKGFEMITTPIAAQFDFYFKNKAGEPDISNLCEAPCDLLTKAGIIIDDKIITLMTARKWFGNDPGTVIRLWDEIGGPNPKW